MDKIEEMNCTHPDHEEGKSCEDRAVACSKDCTCCLKSYCRECQGTGKMWDGYEYVDVCAVCNGDGVA